MATNWHNGDGLLVKFGTNEATPSIVGTYRAAGAVHGVLEINLDLTTLADTNAIINDNCKLPDGALLESIVFVATEAATGTNAVLDLGVIDEDRASNGDDDALLVAIPTTDFDVIGDTLTYVQGTSGHGALVGTILTKSLYITAGYDTAAFTAGQLKIRINYIMTE